MSRDIYHSDLDMDLLNKIIARHNLVLTEEARKRPEYAESLTSLVIKYDDSGPDKEASTDKKCYLDKNWVRVAAYALLLRSDKGEEKS